MSLKGNYFTRNLACQNLGDCSLCEFPIVQEIKTEEAEKNENKVKQKASVKNLLQKVSAILSASVLLSIMYKGL